MTAQVHEKLIFNGKKASMNCCPPVLNSPEVIVKLSEDELNEKIRKGRIPSIVQSTACWRGYIGTWEIKDGKFYLKKLEGCIKKAKRGLILATWFSGEIRIPQGKMLHYVHMGFGSIFEEEVVVQIKKGVVVQQQTIDNRKQAEKLEKAGPGARILEGFLNLPGSEFC